MGKLVQMPSLGKTAARQVFEAKGAEFGELLEMYVIPDDKIEAIVDFGIKTLSKNPLMKVSRIVRKTVDQFKLHKRVHA